MTKISISDEIVNIYPDLQIGAVWGTITSPKESAAVSVGEMRTSAMESLEARGLQTNKLIEFAPIGGWRKAYQLFGAKPKKYKPTHEALVRRLLRDEGWPDIHLLVDVYLTNQVQHVIPHGGYDLDNISGDILLRLSPGEEAFTALGGQVESTDNGEVIYCDEAHILTRRWNYKDSDFTKLTPETKKFGLFLESPSDCISQDAIIEATNDLKRRVEACFDCSTTTAILNAEIRTLQL